MNGRIMGGSTMTEEELTEEELKAMEDLAHSRPDGVIQVHMKNPHSPQYEVLQDVLGSLLSRALTGESVCLSWESSPELIARLSAAGFKVRGERSVHQMGGSFGRIVRQTLIIDGLKIELD